MPIRSKDIAEKMGYCFIQPCFIRVVNEDILDKLRDLGYFDMTGGIQTSEVKTITWAGNCCFGITGFELNDKRYIDCGTNIDLFIALASLRNDTDYEQWFKIPKTKIVKLPGYFGQIIGMDGNMQELIGWEYIKYDKKDNNISEKINFMKSCGEKYLPSKLTINEIIEYFKK